MPLSSLMLKNVQAFRGTVPVSSARVEENNAAAGTVPIGVKLSIFMLLLLL